MTIYLKATVVGIMSGVLLVVLWLLAAFGLQVYPEMLRSSSSGEGGIGAVSVGISLDSGPIVLAAVLAFAAGFYWTVRRARRLRPSGSK